MRLDSIRFLSVDNLTQIHNYTLKHEVGLTGIRDRGLLESAADMPRSMSGGVYLHSRLDEMASAYLFYMCSNHPFVDGNRRIAALAAILFLTVNGVEEEKLPKPDDLEKVTMALVAGNMTKGALTKWFNQCPT